MYWAEPAGAGPAPLKGIAGQGENTWGGAVIYYENPRTALFKPDLNSMYQTLLDPQQGYPGEDDFNSNGHRRLRAASSAVRPVVPAAVSFPSTLEPELLACGPSKEVFAFSGNGGGAMVTPKAVSGNAAETAAPFALQGLVEFGQARGATWTKDGLLLTTTSGAVVSCPVVAGSSSQCSEASVPRLDATDAPAVLIHAEVEGEPLRAAVAAAGKVSFLELAVDAMQEGFAWKLMHEIDAPADVVALSFNQGQLVISAADGSAYRLRLELGLPKGAASRESPSAGPRRTWLAACAVEGGDIVRLASNWRRMASGASAYHAELLL